MTAPEFQKKIVPLLIKKLQNDEVNKEWTAFQI